jgi:hypothetical protein
MIFEIAKMNQNEPNMNRDEPSFIPFSFFSMNQNEPKYNYSKIIIPNNYFYLYYIKHAS